MHGTYTQRQNVALHIIPVITGSISFVSSGTIAVMILKCKDSFSYPFRRLIFGLSIADVIQSGAMMMGPLSLPKEYDTLHWANGNQFTCDLQGFALHIGFAGVPMYVLSLSVYFLSAVKYNINDKKFSEKIEPYLHAISVIWTIAGGIACWVTGVFNVMSSGNVCWYTPFPDNCVTNDDIECIRGEKAFTFGWIFGGSNAITLFGIIFCLVGVCRTVINQEKRNARWSVARVSMQSSENESGLMRRLSSALYASLRRSLSVENDDEQHHTGTPVTLGPALRQSSYVPRAARNSKRKKRETMTQASLYILSFIASCVWAYLYGFLVTIGEEVPFTIILLFSIFYPLGGLFNILVYTRPKLKSVRKRHPNLTWMRCFIEVIKAGVGVPEIIISSERRSVGSSHAALAMSSINDKQKDDKILHDMPRKNSKLLAPLKEDSGPKHILCSAQSQLTMDPNLQDSGHYGGGLDEELGPTEQEHSPLREDIYSTDLGLGTNKFEDFLPSPKGTFPEITE